MSQPFDPHGDTQLSLYGRVLCFRPQGAANAEEILRLLGAINANLRDFEGSDWAALIHIRGADHLLTPDAEAALRAAAPRLVAGGQRALALVTPAGAINALLDRQFNRIYVATDCPVRVFAGEEAAMNWIESRLAR